MLSSHKMKEEKRTMMKNDATVTLDYENKALTTFFLEKLWSWL